MRRFDGQVALVTGGGSGIGRAIALRLGAEGADVALLGRRVDRLEQVAAELRELGRNAEAIPADVTDEAGLGAAVDEAARRLGRLDVVFANAGFSVAGRVEDLTADDWRRQFDVNVVGVAVTARAALPHLRKTGGRLAVVGSVAGLVSVPGYGAYHASKYAVRALGQALAAEVHGTGVSVTLLHPGFVESEIAQVDNRGRFRSDRADRRPRRLMWTAERAAGVMVDAVHRRRRERVFTGHGRLAAWLGQHAPGLVHFVVTRATRRRAPRGEAPGDGSR